MSTDTIRDVDHENHASRGEFECPKCIEHIQRGEAILADLHNAEKEIRTLRRRVKQLEEAKPPTQRRTKDLDDQRLRQHAKYEEAVEVFRFWKQHVAPKAREFSGKRLRHVIARLEAGYTVKDLKLAVYGVARDPTILYGKVHNDLELVCREPHKTDDFMQRGRLAWAYDKAHGLAVAASPEDHKARRGQDAQGRG